MAGSLVKFFKTIKNSLICKFHFNLLELMILVNWQDCCRRWWRKNCNFFILRKENIWWIWNESTRTEI